MKRLIQVSRLAIEYRVVVVPWGATGSQQSCGLEPWLFGDSSSDVEVECRWSSRDRSLKMAIIQVVEESLSASLCVHCAALTLTTTTTCISHHYSLHRTFSYTINLFAISSLSRSSFKSVIKARPNPADCPRNVLKAVSLGNVIDKESHTLLID